MTADPQPNDALTAALDAAARGWRVVPILPGTKRPPIGRWVEVATSDPDKIRAWWGGRYADHGLGVVCGWNAERTSCLFVLDVDEGHAEGVSGGDTLAELESTHGPLPATMEVVTGSGGRHLYYRAAVEIRNDAGRRLGPGLDVRGEGGQVLAPPTIHPTTQQAYAWEAGSADQVADAPNWLVDLLTADQHTWRGASNGDDGPPQWRPVASALPTDRPGDLWAAQTSWADLLSADGWTHSHTTSGVQHWTRPGKSPKDGTSATINFAGTNLLKVFTSSVPELEEGATFSKLGFLAATRHGGDHAAAAKALAADGWKAPAVNLDFLPASQPGEQPRGAPDDGAGDDAGAWKVVDWETVQAIAQGDHAAPETTQLRRTDGTALLYGGRAHTLIGEPGSGKTWVALAAIKEALADGQQAMFIDWEDHPPAVIARLIDLGVPLEDLERFHYVSPGISARGGSLPDSVLEVAAGCQLVVIDSVGEAMADAGVGQNNDDEVALWGRRVIRPLTALGCTVLTLDHVAKDSDARGRWAIGSQRKIAAIDGAAYNVIIVKPFSRESAGIIKLTTAKDRNGTFSQGSTAALISLDPSDGGMTLAINPSDSVTTDGEFMPTHLMEQVSRHLEANPGQSQRSIVEGVTGKADAIRTAIRRLVEAGHIAVSPGPRTALIHNVIHSYRAPELDCVPPRPTASHRVPDAVPKPDDRVPHAGPPPTGGAERDAVRSGAWKPTQETSTASRPWEPF